MTSIELVEALRNKGKLTRTNPENDQAPRYKFKMYSVNKIAEAGGITSYKYNNAVRGACILEEEVLNKMLAYMGYHRLSIIMGGAKKDFFVITPQKALEG